MRERLHQFCKGTIARTAAAGFCRFIGGFGYPGVVVTAFEPNLNHIMAYRIVSTALDFPAIGGELFACGC
jgi:hypothetical protein